MSATAVSPRPAILALAAVIDVVAVLVFAAVGRASHDEPVLAGLALTAWPFLVALAVGWVTLRAWRRPTAPLRTGVGVWLVTVAGGMLLRAVSGQGIALAFVIVATIVLFVFLVGWRGVATLVRRRR
ncbi:MAG: DUF3054 domain-containing protein [Microbacterium sp.]|uniref:DUF3054 domain-containing protein n=1 Tax=Microbacterium sp. TaxID=51671 RepID=UPI00261D011C|nr:DUF3054 domain-containing protein [Microbacterium sp.]MCX6502322.1 DUF3054 domain-containing protein [Microbacterium sp.]